jgi:hypothetical protein
MSCCLWQTDPARTAVAVVIQTPVSIAHFDIYLQAALHLEPAAESATLHRRSTRAVVRPVPVMLPILYASLLN